MRHCLYADEDEFLAATVPFVADGIAAGEAGPRGASPGADQRCCKTRSGRDADAVEFVDMTVLGTTRLGSSRRGESSSTGDQPRVGRGVGSASRSGPVVRDAEVVECQRHEALLNVAFDGGAPWR